jgi:hypothetical protein
MNRKVNSDEYEMFLGKSGKNNLEVDEGPIELYQNTFDENPLADA